MLLGMVEKFAFSFKENLLMNVFHNAFTQLLVVEDVVGKSCREIGASFGIATHKLLHLSIEEDHDVYLPPVSQRGGGSSIGQPLAALT